MDTSKLSALIEKMKDIQGKLSSMDDDSKIDMLTEMLMGFANIIQGLNEITHLITQGLAASMYNIELIEKRLDALEQKS